MKKKYIRRAGFWIGIFYYFFFFVVVAFLGWWGGVGSSLGYFCLFCRGVGIEEDHERALRTFYFMRFLYFTVGMSFCFGGVAANQFSERGTGFRILCCFVEFSYI